MKVLACVDLRRPEPEFVVDEAVAWAARAGATVDLLFARHGASTPEDEATLAALHDRIPDAQRGAVHTPEGPAVDTIAAVSTGFDLTVLGPRPPNPFERVLLGTIPARVVRVSRAPLLVVRPRRPHDGPIRMLCGVDLRHPEPVASAMLAFATRWRVVVDVLYADTLAMPPAGDAAIAASLHKEHEAFRRSDLSALELILGTIPFALRGSVRIAEGDAATALIETSSEYDLVALGTEGRSGVTRLLLGSVAESVLHRAPVTVLVFPPA